MSEPRGISVGSAMIHAVVTFFVAVAVAQRIAQGPGLQISAGVAAAMGMTAVGVASAVLFKWRQHRLSTGLTTGQMVAERLAEVERRESEVESVHARLAELEERLDFSERLLAQGGAEHLPVNRGPS